MFFFYLFHFYFFFFLLFFHLIPYFPNLPPHSHYPLPTTHLNTHPSTPNHLNLSTPNPTQTTTTNSPPPSNTLNQLLKPPNNKLQTQTLPQLKKNPTKLTLTTHHPILLTFNHQKPQPSQTPLKTSSTTLLPTLNHYNLLPRPSYVHKTVHSTKQIVTDCHSWDTSICNRCDV